MAGNSNEVEQVVARTLRDSLAKLQQTTNELNQAVSDLVSACASSRPSNSLPSMLRARSAAASLAASLEVLSKFVVTALQSTSPAETEFFATLPRAAVPVSNPERVESKEFSEPARPQTMTPQPVQPQPLPPEPLPPQAVLAQPPVAESSKSAPAPPAESTPTEVPIPVAAKSEPPVGEPQPSEPIAASVVPQEPEAAEPLQQATPPQAAPVQADLNRTVEFAVVAEPATPEPVVSAPPILDLPPFERPSPSGTAFNPVVFEQPSADAIEPAKIEPVPEEGAVTKAAPETVLETEPETAELYELATWKEPSQSEPAAPEAEAAEPEPPRTRIEEPVLEASTPVEMRRSEEPNQARIEIPAVEVSNIEAPAEEPAAEDLIADEVSADEFLSDDLLVDDEPIDIDAPGLVTASTLSGEIPLIHELPPEEKGFDLLALSPDQQELHRRANRVAKVSMQDVKMLRPRDVALGKENKDICIRLRDDIEKAHKEYDRRFHAILDHPVDYFYDWMVEILGDGDPESLGEYPYPSSVLRR